MLTNPFMRYNEKSLMDFAESKDISFNPSEMLFLIFLWCRYYGYIERKENSLWEKKSLNKVVFLFLCSLIKD